MRQGIKRSIVVWDEEEVNRFWCWLFGIKCVHPTSLRHYTTPWSIVMQTGNRCFCKRDWTCGKMGCAYFSTDFEYMFADQVEYLNRLYKGRGV